MSGTTLFYYSTAKIEATPTIRQNMATNDDKDGEKARVQELLATMKLMSKVSYNFKYQARAKEVLPNVIHVTDSRSFASCVRHGPKLGITMYRILIAYLKDV